nr:nuclear transport factor 2 family protein [uncultured Bacteroides sp.]
MKTKLLFWILFVTTLLSCTSKDKTVSEAEKGIIKKEVKKIVNMFFVGCEQTNFSLVMKTMNYSPEFRYIYNGNVLTYEDCISIFKPLFKTQEGQKFNILDEKYEILDNSTVLYTAKINSRTDYKDGHYILVDQGVIFFVFKRIDVRWQILYGVESTVEKTVNDNKKRDLNQIKLFKQFAGTWKGKLSKDSTFVWTGKYSNSKIEGNFKVLVKKKTVVEAKVLNVYDKSTDTFIETEIYKSSHPMVFVSRFTSGKICEAVPFKDSSDPEQAKLKTRFEFKRPDMFVQITTLNNTPIDTLICYRIKK